MKKNNKKVVAYGATSKSTTVTNYFGIDKGLVECIFDNTPIKQNKLSPGKHIPVLMETDLETHPDTYFVLAWNFKDEILRRNASLVSSGVEFYFPISAGASE